MCFRRVSSTNSNAVLELHLVVTRTNCTLKALVETFTAVGRFKDLYCRFITGWKKICNSRPGQPIKKNNNNYINVIKNDLKAISDGISNKEN